MARIKKKVEYGCSSVTKPLIEMWKARNPKTTGPSFLPPALLMLSYKTVEIKNGLDGLEKKFFKTISSKTSSFLLTGHENEPTLKPRVRFDCRAIVVIADARDFHNVCPWRPVCGVLPPPPPPGYRGLTSSPQTNTMRINAEPYLRGRQRGLGRKNFR